MYSNILRYRGLLNGNMETEQASNGFARVQYKIHFNIE